MFPPAAPMLPSPMLSEQPPDVIAREAPDVAKPRSALVKELQSQVREARSHWEKRFKLMRSWQRFARGWQWVDQMELDDRYICNITLRHVQQRTAALYAKNPKAVARRRKRLDFTMWDESPEQLLQLQQKLAMGAMMPQDMMLYADIMQGKQMRDMIDRVGKTLEIVYEYQLSEPIPDFKAQLKQLVRRTLVNGAGYLKLGYKRLMEYSPDIQSQLQDAARKIAEMQRIAADRADDEFDDDDLELEQLRIMVQTLQKSEQLISREGLDFSFPASTAIIVDPACTQLNGFVGAAWVAEEFCFSFDDIKRDFGIDVGAAGASTRKYRNSGERMPQNSRQKPYATVWDYYDLVQQQRYWLCDGYEDFLNKADENGEPDFSPDVDCEQFHPYFVLMFNEVEDEQDIFPPSNVEVLRAQQLEINRSREALRQHRIGARPGTWGSTGFLQEEDKDRLETRRTHEHIELKIPPGTKIADVLQQIPHQGVDPALYEVDSIFTDVLRSTGDQEANFGGTSDSTATESTFAENTRMSTLDSNRDELDAFLTKFAKAAGQVLLLEMDVATATEIAGRGAAWPTVSREEVAKELYLEVAAGSSGRPNKAINVSTLERLAPIVLQIPGMKPSWLAKKFQEEIDPDVDFTDAYLAGLPSMTQLNAVKQPAQGGEAEDPNAQGAEGQNNAQQPPGPETQAPGGPPPTLQ